MKRNYSLGILLLLCVTACQKKTDLKSVDTTTSDAPLSSAAISPEVISFFSAAGFHISDLRVSGDCYLVEGDILIDQKTVQAAIQSKRTAVSGKIRPDQYAVNRINSADGTGIVNWAKTQNITYYIDPSVTALADGADWAAAIVTATQNWTNIPNCSVSFNQVFAPANAQLTFYRDDAATIPGGGTVLNGNVYAASRYPQNGFIGSAILINPFGPATNAAGKVTTIRHEIGHTLGMRHSDYAQNGEPVNGTGLNGQVVNGADLLNETPSNDASSVMIHAYAGTASINFDMYDNYAAQQLYPDNIAPAFRFGWIPNNRTSRDVLDLYINSTGGNFWYSIKIERLDGAGNVISTINASGPDGIYNAPYIVMNDYGTIPGPNVDRTFRITVYNYKGDFSISTIMVSPTFS